jgi:inosine/xanthosine triphosphatase
MKVLVGSKNPVKIEAVKEAFSKYFDDVKVIGIEVESKVSNQPINDETFEGAKNRALELKRTSKEKNLNARFFVGIEGGIIKLYSKWFASGVMCIIDERGRVGFGMTPHFELPEDITKQLLSGVELGDVMDKITGEYNTKQKSGAIGFFTKGVMDRKNLYVQGLIVALIPFINENLYFSSGK